MAPVAGDTSEDEDTDEEVEENDTGAPRMYAYEYDAKTNELNQVRIVTNPAEEDYLGIQTKEVQTEATGENEAKTSVQVATVYSSSSVLLAEKGSSATAKEKLKKVMLFTRLITS